MDVKQLQYFVVSVDMGSFHSAAEALITTQPNVSKIVKSLEDELNMTLLNRTRSGVIITPQGERIYAYAIEVLKNINMINEFKKGQEIETLSISSVPSNTLSFYLSQFYNINKQEKDILTSDNEKIYDTIPITAKSEIRVLENSMEAIPILNQLSDQLEGFELQQGTMDDVFLAVTGKSLKGGNI